MNILIKQSDNSTRHKLLQQRFEREKGDQEPKTRVCKEKINRSRTEEHKEIILVKKDLNRTISGENNDEFVEISRPARTERREASGRREDGIFGGSCRLYLKGNGVTQPSKL